MLYPPSSKDALLEFPGPSLYGSKFVSLKIKAVGFDMDYTLAQYFTAFDQLAFDGAKEKLVRDLGYPDAVDGFNYDPEYFSRGLVIDLERGECILTTVVLLVPLMPSKIPFVFVSLP